ncbi:LacI family DNA-binding transcriptional regulator [Iocasia frigidifontis]|uniref:LacI family DNA-binding transcriptional regulator n=1 Tax=Iocasia fonsfrigidae TaxID=2682810 RepID=A0A8A7KCK1_9FIRM|nr:LacI family DNA-binding transcriptional regulator [Iocasia fonsfrigidae]QTL97328.1 LacI family DNA-binding transcriptional regulator [Iocasia fonsfrigidae]
MAINNNKISIKDVAKLAGVSITTVSRVINNSKHPVSSKTRVEVQKAIKELNFQPNRLAQGLINNKSSIIGVIVHDISDTYFSEMVKGIEEVTFENDYIINIYNTDRDIHKELQAVNMLKANQAEAIVFTGGHLIDDFYDQQIRGYIKQLKQQGCYIISVNPYPYDIRDIDIGNKLATRTITEYLFNKGHENIAYVTGPAISHTTWERFSGYKDALKNKGLIFREEYVISGDFTFEGGRKAALELLNRISDITAVVTANDATALGLMWELKHNGVNIPEDVSVVGIGNIPETKYAYPPLTTIALPLFELGKKIGNCLMSKLLNNKVILEDIDVKIGLIERKSVKNLL